MSRNQVDPHIEDTGEPRGVQISDPASPAIATWQPLRGPFQRWPRLMDTLLAALAFWLTMVMWSPMSEQTPGSFGVPDLSFSQALALILAVAGNFALVWRRRYPLQVHGVIVLCSALVLIATTQDGLFGTAISLYSLGRYAANDRASLLGMLASLLLAVIAMNMLDFGNVVAASLIVLFWYVGRRLRFRGEYLRLLEERAEHLDRSKSAEAQRAVAQERTRIAREMHDIVAHQVSLMTVQAGAAKTVAKSNPGAAIAAMGAVEDAGRQALREMRHLLDVLRPERPDAELAPQPGLSKLAQLAQEVSDAGTPVELTVNGEAAQLPAGVDLALYRIAQESLTNVIKHAGDAASAMIEIDILDASVTLVVRDTGGGRRVIAQQGHGIAGMRERAELLDGTLEAGPSGIGGFEVRVSLPLPSGFALQKPGRDL